MARLWSSGVELNDVYSNAEFSNLNAAGSATRTVVSSPVRSGTYSFRSENTTASSNGTSYIGHSFASAVGAGPYYARVYFRYAALGATTTAILVFSSGSGTTNLASLSIKTNGTLILKNGTTQIGVPSTNLSADTWYRLELFFYDNPSSGFQELEARVDGSSFASTTTGTSS